MGRQDDELEMPEARRSLSGYRAGYQLLRVIRVQYIVRGRGKLRVLSRQRLVRPLLLPTLLPGRRGGKAAAL
jgi:hypothetical protein